MLEQAEVEIFGTCDDRFLPVREAFEENFASQLELGASVAVTVGGQGGVDLWAGAANPAGDYGAWCGANGKEGVLVPHVMSRSAGLSGFDPPVQVEDLYDWDRIVSQ